MCSAEPPPSCRLDGEGLLGSVSGTLGQCVESCSLVPLVFFTAVRLQSM